MNLEYYKVFYYVCQKGSFTGAAQDLCISQPAISQMIRQMEKEAGVRLFARTPKGVTPTREGEALLCYVKTGVEQLLEGERLLQRMRDMDMGEVRIGASDMTLQFFLLPYLETFHRRYPDIKVNVTNAPTPETIRSLEMGKLDFGLVTTPFSGSGNISRQKVKEIRSLFIAGSAFSHLRGKVLEYQALEELPCIFLEENTSTRRFMDEFLLDQGIQLKPEFELAISDMIVQFVRRNMGIGCVMEGFAEEAIERGDVFPLTFSHEMPSRHICVVTSDTSLISMAGCRLLEMILDTQSYCS